MVAAGGDHPRIYGSSDRSGAAIGHVQAAASRRVPRGTRPHPRPPTGAGTPRRTADTREITASGRPTKCAAVDLRSTTKSKWGSTFTTSRSLPPFRAFTPKCRKHCTRLPDLDIGRMSSPMLPFGSSIGGDRDGNPFVTPQITRDAMGLARGHLLLYYQRQLEEIIDLLTTSGRQIPVSEELLARLEAYVAEIHTPEAQVFGEQYEFEYYRRFVICVKARIQRTLEQPGHGSAQLPVTPPTRWPRARTRLPRRFPTVQCSDFIGDLEALRASLAANRGLRIAHTAAVIVRHTRDVACPIVVPRFRPATCRVRLRRGIPVRVERHASSRDPQASRTSSVGMTRPRTEEVRPHRRRPTKN